MMKHKVIWYSFALLFLFILVLTISVSGQEIIVDPESIEVNLTGGDTVIKYITIRWTGSDTVSCNISTNITSDCPRNDSEGIYVTYSENLSFDLPAKVDYPVNMTIKAAINIMPGNYTITTTFSCTAEEEPQPPSPPLKPPYHPPGNIRPVADASAGEQYTGYVGEEITFDGSKSFDIDGTINKWYWEFGDGTSGTGRVTTHIYSNPGTYNVILTVTDNRNAMDSYETTATIQQPNRPPTTPIITGTKIGNKTIEYTYTSLSTDPENDTIRYFFDWDDGTNMTTDFLASGIIFNVSHNWTNRGLYVITVYAEDINGSVSNTTEMRVFIDMNVRFIDDMIQGYLLDVYDDGIYAIFHNDATGSYTIVELQDNGNYLIDSDGDALWDYEYDPETDTLTPHTPAEEEKDDIAFWYVLIALIAMVAICSIGFVYFMYRVNVFAYFMRRVKKKKKNE